MFQQSPKICSKMSPLIFVNFLAFSLKVLRVEKSSCVHVHAFNVVLEEMHLIYVLYLSVA